MACGSGTRRPGNHRGGTYDTREVIHGGGGEQDDAQLSLNVSSDAALDNEVNKMGYNESLKKSLKEALSKKLSKK